MARPVRPSIWFLPGAFGCAAILYAIFMALQIIQAGLELESAFDLGKPAPVVLDSFSRARDIRAADEINVTGWINPKLTTGIRISYGMDESDSYTMFLMIGLDDAQDTNVVRAALLMDDRYPQGLEDQIGPIPDLRTDPWLKTTVNGRAVETFRARKFVDEVLAEHGLTKSAQFIFIAPWEVDRETDLSRTAATDFRPAGIWAAIGVTSVLVSALLLWRNRRILAEMGPEQAALVVAEIRTSGRRRLKKLLLWLVLAVFVILAAGYGFSRLRDYLLTMRPQVQQ